jgi:diguanylate cyclase (GGDEF)-like protein
MKILLADDDALTRLRLGRLLEKWGYDVVTACDGVESWQLLEQDDAPQLAILDWRMPGISGVELCRRLREKARERYVYVLLLTGNDRKEDVVAGLEAGSDDYLTKPFSPEELHVRLRAGRRILELEEALRFQATRDALTQAWNRRGILALLDRELARAEREQGSVAVLLADVDYFKRVNDVHGHQVGDAVLVEIARRMADSLRSCDGVGRYGGEEFLVVAPGHRFTSAQEIGERLRAQIAHDPVVAFGVTIPVSASFGVTVSTPGAPAAALLRAADEALYRAKAQGRNRVESAPDPEATPARCAEVAA